MAEGRVLGKSGIEVSALGMGCMGITHASGDPMADDDAVRAAFSVLNAAQLARLLQYYHPDAFNTLSVDPALINSMKLKGLDAEDAPLKADGHAWCTAPAPRRA